MKRLAVLSAALFSVACAPAVETEKLDFGAGTLLEIVKIPAGSFEMGSPPAEKSRGSDEDLHRVEIAEPFWIGRYPVTRGQFARFARETGYKTEAEKGTSGGYGFDGTALVQRKEFTWRNPGFEQTDEHPVVLITHGDARAFVGWLSGKVGRKIALPTEAQWEYACRAGTTTRYYNGDADEDATAIAWFKDNAGQGSKPVGGKQANAFGLFDMCGNVYEWCADTYGPYVPGGGVQGPMDKPRFVLRGGSWFKGAGHVRSAARARNTPGSRNADNGFRVVAGPPAAAQPIAPVRPDVPVGPAQGDGNASRGTLLESPETPVVPPITPPPPSFTVPPTAPQVSGGVLTVFFGAMVFFALIVGVAVIAIFIAAKRARVSSHDPSPSSPTNLRVQDDGFWVDTSGCRPGEVVNYSYMGPNGPVTENFQVEPSARGQFVYTGVRPSDLMIAGIIAGEVERHHRETTPPPEPARYQPPRKEEDAFHGFPSAY